MSIADNNTIEIIVPPYAMSKPYHITGELSHTGVEADGTLLHLLDSEIDVHDKVRIEEQGGSFIRQECEMEGGKVSKSLALFIPKHDENGNKIHYKIGRTNLRITKPFSASERA